MKPKIAFVGDLTVDVYPKLKKIRLGGASLISAIWAKRLGAKATILAAVGDDREGKQYKDFFKKHNLSLNFLFTRRSQGGLGEGRTSRIEIFLDKNGEHRFGQWQPGAYAKYHLGPKEKDFLKTQDAIVLPVYFKTRHLLGELLSVQNEVRPRTRTHLDKQPRLVVDFDDLSQFGKSTKVIEDNLEYIDIVKVGLDINKDKELINKLQTLFVKRSHLVQGATLITTLGPHGSMAVACGRVFRQKAYPPVGGKVVDTTGAGDAFLAGFLVEYIKTLNIPNSLKKGTEIATKAIQKIGAY